ncbi:MAG: 4Fe-4S binding protein, partial [Chloroflexia bacterium]
RGESVVLERTASRPVVRLSLEEIGEQPRLGRQEPPVLAARRRRRLFEEVEKAFTPEQAVTEASRCLSCAVCSECLACVAACRAGAIDHALLPQDLLLEADMLLDAGGYRLALPEGALQAAEERMLERAGGAVLSRVEPLGAGRAPFVALSRPDRIGLFVCRCGGTIPAESIVAGFREEAHLSRVEVVDQACTPEGLAQIRQAAGGLDAAVLGGCSCCNLAQVCFACTTQRLRCRTGLGVWEGVEGIPPPWAWEYVNLREQCVWIYGPEEAQRAALELLSGAFARLRNGPAAPVVATVDRARCRTCGTCVEVCRAEALRLEDGSGGWVRLEVEGGRCLACGTCAAHCPTGALQAGRVGDGQIEAT